MEDLNYCVFVAIGEEYHSVLKFKTQCLPTSRHFIAENCRNTVFTLQTNVFWCGHSNKILYLCRVCVLLSNEKRPFFFKIFFTMCRVCVHAKIQSKP